MGVSLSPSNLTQYLDSIPSLSMPITIQQAIKVAQEINISYLWVDSLCIMQDDPEDWRTESALMSKVYGFSACTIAAAGSTGADDGLVRKRNQLRIRPLKIPNPFNHDSLIEFLICPEYLGPIYETVKASVWHERSWVFQERLLSQRLLIFGERQVLWACQHLQAGESCPRGKTSQFHIDRFESFEVERLRLRSLLEHGRMLSSGDREWEKVVAQYTRTQTTRKSDRLIALQGIADRIVSSTNRRYVAWMWFDESLPRTLLWRAKQDQLTSHPPGERRPSWSWGSIDGPVQFDDTNIRGDFLHMRRLELCSSPLKQTDSALTYPVLIIDAPFVEGLLHIKTAKNVALLRRHGYVPPPIKRPPWLTSTNAWNVLFGMIYFLIGLIAIPLALATLPLWVPCYFYGRFEERRARQRRRQNAEPPERVYRALSPPVLHQPKMKYPSDPGTVRATCYLDNATLKDGSHKVHCMVVIRSDELLGLLVQPTQTQNRAVDSERPQYERVGMFACDRFDPDFTDLEQKIQEILLV